MSWVPRLKARFYDPAKGWQDGTSRYLEMIDGSIHPDDRVLDGRSVWPMLSDPDAPSPHEAIYGMQGANLSTIRSGKWKLHVRSPGPVRFANLSPDELANWVDPRGPDGVTILAPYEQARPNQHPGLTSGDAPQPMMLFDLESDPGEQHNVADQHPDIVQRLRTMFDQTLAEVPAFDDPEPAYLFRSERGKPRTLMRLIGGELRYDRVPKSQQHLLRQ